MGTDKPNANAVLELFAKDYSQGFLVPRLTTAQRTAAAFTSRLSQVDHGLLVFDTDQGAFYFWFEGKWEQSIGEDSNILKKANWYAGNTAPNMPAENGDFYINNTSGDLYRHQNGTFEIIGNIKEKSYQAGAGIRVDTDGTIANTGDLSNTNEIQALELTTHTLKITNNPTAKAIDLTKYLDNTDQQVLSFDPITQKLSLSNGGTVNLSSINTDSQDLNLNGNTLSLTGDATSVNLSATSPANGQVLKWNAAQNRWEAQSDAIGTTYTAGTGISINSSNQIINTAPNQAISLTGTGAVTISGAYPNFTIKATDNTNDADSNSTNEIQDLQISGNTLKITNNAAATNINLAGYLDNTDQQTLSFDTTTQQLSLTNGGMVNLGGINTDAQDLSFNGNTLSLTGDNTSVNLSATLPADGQVLKWSTLQNRWEAQSDAIGITYAAGTGISISGSNQIINTAPNQAVSLTGTGAVTVSGAYPNFTINATDNVNDADNDPVNEIQDLQLTGNMLKVTNNAAATNINLVGYLDNTDAQTLSFNTTTQALSLSNGGMVNLGSINTDAQNLSDVLSKGNNAGGSQITNLGTPVAANDATTKSYVDAVKALPEGNILVGNSAGVAIPLDAKTAGNILVGNGTTVASIAITGELVLQADGTLTINNLAVTTQKIADGAITTQKIADNAVTKEKINADVAGNGLGKNTTDGSLEVKVASGSGIQLTGDQLTLTNTGNTQVLLGDGTNINARTLSGDISLTNTGAVTTTGLQSKPVATTAPASGQVLTWNGTQWTPQTPSGGSSQQWYQGTNTPTVGNPAGASSGDYYYDTDDNIVYLYDGITWSKAGGFAKTADVNMGTKADSYRVPLLYIGDVKPVDGPIDSNMGDIGDFYYSKIEKKMYYKYLDGSTIKWQSF